MLFKLFDGWILKSLRGEILPNVRYFSHTTRRKHSDLEIESFMRCEFILIHAHRKRWITPPVHRLELDLKSNKGIAQDWKGESDTAILTNDAYYSVYIQVLYRFSMFFICFQNLSTKKKRPLRKGPAPLPEGCRFHLHKWQWSQSAPSLHPLDLELYLHAGLMGPIGPIGRPCTL